VGAAAVLGGGAAGGAALAQTIGAPAGTTVESKAKPHSGVAWAATSKAAPKGSHFKLEIKNGAAAQNVGVRSVVTDNPKGKPTPNEQKLQLAAGETKTIDISNDVSDKARLHLRVLSQNSDVQLQVTVTNSSGAVI